MMLSRLKKYIVVFALALPLLIKASGAGQMTPFETLLAEAGLKLASISVLREIKTPANTLYDFEKTYKHAAKPLEIRYAIRPIKRMEIEYNDPHNSAPKPDHMFPLVFQTLIGHLSSDGHVPTREYDPVKAKKLFNADWAAAAMFKTDPELNSQYTSGMLLAIHKSHMGDAYSLFLFNDARAVKAELDRLVTRLHFAATDAASK